MAMMMMTRTLSQNSQQFRFDDMLSSRNFERRKVFLLRWRHSHSATANFVIFCTRKDSEKIPKSDQVMAEISKSHQPGLGKMDFFKNIPDEILLMIGEACDPESVKALRGVSVRFRRLAFMLIRKIDWHFLQNEPNLHEDYEIFEFILKCPNLNTLSLIGLEDKKITEPLLAHLMTDASGAEKVAKSLANHCCKIRTIEVSGVRALRMVREYAKRLNKKGRCKLEEIRAYAVRDYNCFYHVMKAVNQYCPKLNTFKLLQREKVDRRRKLKVPFQDLWEEMASKLTKFSTNVDKEEIVDQAISSLNNLERIVVWGLRQDAIITLSQTMVHLRILILMSVDLTGIYHIADLKHLSELHIKVAHGYSPPVGVEAVALKEDFKHVFKEIGSNLKKMLFNFRRTSTSHLLDSVPKYCTSLIELGFSECVDCGHLFKLAAKVQKLELFMWNSNVKKTSVSKDVQVYCNNLCRAKPTIKRVVAYNFIYIPVNDSCENLHH